jgi:hypothetical protein
MKHFGLLISIFGFSPTAAPSRCAYSLSGSLAR